MLPFKPLSRLSTIDRPRPECPRPLELTNGSKILFFISAGIAKIDASRAGLLLILQPTLAFVWDILFFARPTGLMEMLGALVTLFSIYLGTIRSKR